MTNLIGSKKQRDLVTPENSLIFIPVIIGFISFSSLLIFVFRPLMNKLSIEESRIEVLEDKISYIPIYKKYIKKLSINTTKAKKQQHRLVDLISDKNQPSSFLTEINKLCTKNGLTIENLILQPIVKYNNINNKINNVNKSKDPFLVKSIEKHNYKLTIKGNYNSLINLLKGLESLKSIAIIDGIDISKDPLNENKYNPILSMSFNLITYANTNKKISNYKLNSI